MGYIFATDSTNLFAYLLVFAQLSL